VFQTILAVTVKHFQPGESRVGTRLLEWVPHSSVMLTAANVVKETENVSVSGKVWSQS
jgi:hypothetical protein